MKNILNYVQLEPAAFLSDAEFQLMLADERGVYFSIILYLYKNNGKLQVDAGAKHLALLSNYSGQNWEQVWKKIEKKFFITEGVLTHKRVTKELKKARKAMQVAHNAGVRGAKVRWGKQCDPHSDPNATLIAKGREGKGRERKSIYSPDSPSVQLSELLFSEIQKRKPDIKRPDIQKWAVHIDRMIRIDKRSAKSIAAVIQWCQADDFWQNNILGTEKLRKQFDQLELKMQKGNNGNSRNSKPRRGSFAEQQSSVGETIED